MASIQNSSEAYLSNREYPTRELLRRFVPYYRKHIPVMAADLACAALTTICDIVLPMIIRHITNTGVSDIAALTAAVVGKLALLYLVLRVIDCSANFFMAYTGHVMGVKIETDMRSDAYRHLQYMSDSYYSNVKVGQLMSRLTADLFDVTEFAHHCPEEFFIAGVKGLAAFIILMSVNVPLTLMIFAIIPFMLVICIKLNRRNRRAFAAQRIQTGDINAGIEDSLLGQKVVKAFTGEEREIEKFELGNSKFRDIKKVAYRYMAAFQTSTRAFDGLMYLTVILAGGLFLINGAISPGDLVAYVMYVSTFIVTIRRIIEFAEQFQRGMTGIERFLQIMDSEQEITDEPGALEMPEPSGHIEFDHVSFRYSDGSDQVFTSLSLEVRPGEQLAIVGPSGGGKTTLCNLIPRFYDIEGGEIRIDGVNIRNYSLKSLRKHIGIVQQDVYLFSGTVLENILYGSETASREDAIEAAKKAGAHEFISKLRDGYDSYVGERGVKLSGGQKQRISIARMFLKDPAIMILDEATSALDNESEFEVAKSLKKLSEGRTTITIAHRLSSIKNSDRIIVLTEDGIAEEGDHAMLMEKRGLYHSFYTMADCLR